MSKIRRSSIDDTSKQRDKNENTNVKKNKLISHTEFMNRIQKSMYYGRAKLSIPLSDYITESFSETHNRYSLNRLDKSVISELRTTPCSLIIALIYFERLKDADPAYCKQITPTELFLISMMVATKFYSGHDDDSPSVNWSELAKTTPDNLLKMELSFLASLNWNVFVSNEEFFDKVKTIEENLATKQGLHRGWFTYMELNILMPSIKISKTFMEITFVLGLSYTAFVATIVASFFLVSIIPGNCLRPQSKDVTSLSSNETMDNSNIEIDTHINNADNTTVIDDLSFVESVINEANQQNQNQTQTVHNQTTKQSISNELFNWPVIINQIIASKINFCNEPMILNNDEAKQFNSTIDKSFINELFHFKNNPIIPMKTEHTKFQLI